MVDIAKVLHDQATAAGMVVLESDLPANGLAINLYGQYYFSQVNWKPEEDAWAAPGEKGRLAREAGNHIYDNYRSIPVVWTNPTLVVNPAVPSQPYCRKFVHRR